MATRREYFPARFAWNKGPASRMAGPVFVFGGAGRQIGFFRMVSVCNSYGEQGRMRPARARRALICQGRGKGPGGHIGDRRRLRTAVRQRQLAGGRNSEPSGREDNQWSWHFQCRASRLAPQGRGVMRRWQRPERGQGPLGLRSLNVLGLLAVLCASSRCKWEESDGSLRRCTCPVGQGGAAVCGGDAVCPAGKGAAEETVPNFV